MTHEKIGGDAERRHQRDQEFGAEQGQLADKSVTALKRSPEKYLDHKKRGV